MRNKNLVKKLKKWVASILGGLCGLGVGPQQAINAGSPQVMDPKKPNNDEKERETVGSNMFGLGAVISGFGIWYFLETNETLGQLQPLTDTGAMVLRIRVNNNAIRTHIYQPGEIQQLRKIKNLAFGGIIIGAVLMIIGWWKCPKGSGEQQHEKLARKEKTK